MDTKTPAEVSEEANGRTMSDTYLGWHVRELSEKYDPVSGLGAAVRALFADPSQPPSDELAEVRADIARTAAVVQALATVDPARVVVPPGFYAEVSHQCAVLTTLLARERELTEKGGK
jgi:hypothetical protein